MPSCEERGYEAALRGAEHIEPSQPQRRDDSLERPHLRLRREVAPLTIRQPGARFVVTDNRPFLGQLLVEASIRAGLPHDLQVADPPRVADQSRSSTDRRVRDAG